MSNPITNCHQVPAKIYSSDEGTNSYYCPECEQAVNPDGSNPKQLTAEEILETAFNMALQDVVSPSNVSMIPKGHIDQALARLHQSLKERMPKLLTEESFERLKKDYPELDKTDFYHFALDQVNEILNDFFGGGGK